MFGTRMMPERKLPVATTLPSGGIYPRLALLMLLVSSLPAGLLGCNLFTGRGESALYYNLPLTVQIRPDSSMTGAVLDYRDACGQPSQIKIDGILQNTIKRKLGLVFEHVIVDASDVPGPVDGIVDVRLGLKQLELFVVRKADRAYPATATLGLDFSYSDLDGTIRHSKKLQSQSRDDVTTTKDSCEVKGVEAVVQQAAETVVEGMAKQLGDSSKVREAAQSVKSRPRVAGQSAGRRTTDSAAAAPSSAPAPPSGIDSVVAAPPRQSPPSMERRESGPTKLSFRTIIRDENRNQVLERNEHFIVEFEIKNEGNAAANDVEVHLAGHPAVMHNLKPPVLVGAIGPGEIKRVSIAGTLGEVSDVEAAELVCTLRAASTVELPPSKKFVVAIRPETVDAVEVLSVDVDQIADPPGKFKQSQGIGIAIGVGQFRDSSMPEARYAGRDAEVMAKYFKTYVGIPSARVKLLEDAQVLKDDLIDVFETWLPKQVDPRAVALVYFSGRAVVDAAGVVSLVPYDGSTSARLFSLARLQRAMARAQVSRAILFLDLSMEPMPGTEAGRAIAPVWDADESSQHKDRFMWMIGNNSVQEAHAYQQGQHGLFTYYLLKGLRGAADLDKNGTVLSGELCTYVHRQVEAVAKHQFGNAQEPVCLPDAGQASPLRALPLSKQR